MAYAAVTTIVDGALDEEATLYDHLRLQEYLDALIADLEGEGYPASVYVQYHDHEPGECECAQYEQSHRPYWTNEEGS